MFQISETPVINCRNFLEKNILINIHDPYMNKINSYKGKILSLLIGKIFQGSEVLIFAVPHDFYKKADLQIIKKQKNCLFFDIRAK